MEKTNAINTTTTVARIDILVFKNVILTVGFNENDEYLWSSLDDEVYKRIVDEKTGETISLVTPQEIETLADIMILDEYADDDYINELIENASSTSADSLESETIKVGLCKGYLPEFVYHYIFSEVKNPFDFNNHKKTIENWMQENVLNRPNKGVDLYVTGVESGLNPYLPSVIMVFQQYNVPLTLWHFDKSTFRYVPQVII